MTKRKQMKTKHYLIAFSVLLVACSSPSPCPCPSLMFKKFSLETSDADVDKLQNEIGAVDAQTIRATIVRHMMRQEPLSHMTYGEILEEGKAYNSAQGW